MDIETLLIKDQEFSYKKYPETLAKFNSRINELVDYARSFEWAIQDISKSSLYPFVDSTICDFNEYSQKFKDQLARSDQLLDSLDDFDPFDPVMLHLQQMAKLNTYCLQEMLEVQKFEYMADDVDFDGIHANFTDIEEMNAPLAKLCFQMRMEDRINKALHDFQSHLVTIAENTYHVANHLYGFEIPDNNEKRKEVESALREVNPELSKFLKKSFNKQSDYKRIYGLRNNYQHGIGQDQIRLDPVWDENHMDKPAFKCVHESQNPNLMRYMLSDYLTMTKKVETALNMMRQVFIERADVRTDSIHS